MYGLHVFASMVDWWFLTPPAFRCMPGDSYAACPRCGAVYRAPGPGRDPLKRGCFAYCGWGVD